MPNPFTFKDFREVADTMTIAELTASAVAPYTHKVLTAREIQVVVRSVYPFVNPNSIKPSAMSTLISSLRVFEQVAKNMYRVLPPEERTRSRSFRYAQPNQTDAEVLAALEVRIAESD